MANLLQNPSAHLTATNDIGYILRDDWKAQEILMNVQSGEAVEVWEKDSFGNLKERTLNPKRKAASSHEHYFKSLDEDGRRIMGEFRKRMQRSMFDSHLGLRLVRFMVENPGIWGLGHNVATTPAPLSRDDSHNSIP